METEEEEQSFRQNQKRLEVPHLSEGNERV